MDNRVAGMTLLSCGCEWNGKHWFYCAQHERPDAAVPKEEVPCIQKGCDKVNGHSGRHSDGTLPGHLTASPPTDTAQPVDSWKWRQYLRPRTFAPHWGPWHWQDHEPHLFDCDVEIQPLYAHPEDAPETLTEMEWKAILDAMLLTEEQCPLVSDAHFTAKEKVRAAIPYPTARGLFAQKGKG